MATASVLGSWVGVRRIFHLSLFLTASRMVLPKILVLTCKGLWRRHRRARPRLRVCTVRGRRARCGKVWCGGSTAAVYPRCGDAQRQSARRDHRCASTRILGRRTAPCSTSPYYSSRPAWSYPKILVLTRDDDAVECSVTPPAVTKARHALVPRLILPSFLVLAGACLGRLRARIWVLTSPDA